MEHVYLGRQPILDKKSAIIAYEVLYRDDDMQAHINNNRYASASVINNVLNKFGTTSLLGNRRAFVKIDIKFLLHDMIMSIPKEFFVFALFGDVDLNERVVERLQQLYAKGYKLAINDVTLDENKIKEYAKVSKELSYVKINIDKEPNEQTKKMIASLKEHDIKVIGTKIENTAHYELAKELGCDLFQGYFFAKPNIIENAKYEPGQLDVLKLYNLLISDTNIDEITAEFEHNHEITVQLLRFINSCAFHFKNKISSIHHILTLVGRKPLSRWLMLMIYSKSVSKSATHSPLMLMVKNRTELMEKILKTVKPDAQSNLLGEAYFIGVLSLLDTLFGVELKVILDDLNVSDEVANALLGCDDNILSDIYTLVIDIEEFDLKAVENFNKKYHLEPHALKQIILQSMEEVNNFEDSISA